MRPTSSLKRSKIISTIATQHIMYISTICHQKSISYTFKYTIHVWGCQHFLHNDDIFSE
jgi:hypothetical protein